MESFEVGAAMLVLISEPRSFALMVLSLREVISQRWADELREYEVLASGMVVSGSVFP